MGTRPIYIKVFLAVLTAGAVLAGSGASPAQGATFTVNTAVDHTDDDTCDADCTLREAIHLSNLAPGADIIHFDIAGGAIQTISLLWPLPDVTGPLTIDGTSQPGYAGTPVIQINGTNAGAPAPGLRILDGPAVIRGLVINRFDGNGIYIGDQAGNFQTSLIEGNYVGTSLDGGNALGNYNGIYLRYANGVTIRQNLVSSNENDGIVLSRANSNTVQGNLIGTNWSGLTPLPNGGAGITLADVIPDNLIGGPSAGDRNIISGNSTSGVVCYGGVNSNITIEGNYIGVNSTGNAAMANGSSGLAIGSGCLTTVRENVISGNAESGVRLHDGVQGSVVRGNLIGTNAAGNGALPNADNGVLITGGASGNTVGGTSAFGRNAISGNSSSGVRLDGAGAGNIISGNYIGTNQTGNGAIGNSLEGVLIVDSPNTTVGGTTAGARNVISGNLIGVQISGNGAGVVVEGNYVGTSSSGATAVPNEMNGVQIVGSGSLIGGPSPGAANVIAGNGDNGVFLFSAAAIDNHIQGNLIGTAADGLTPLPNDDHGVRAEASGANVIGGSADGAGNVIAHNGADGVAIILGIGGSHNKAVLGNSIFANAGAGIDLDDDGVTLNDPGDGDDGANGRQNFPVLADAESDGQNTFLGSVDLNSAPNTTFRIEFFASQACDPSGHGEGEDFIGWAPATTDGAGDASFNISFSGVAVADGWFLTATATDPDDNTSEFSACAEVIGAEPSPTPTPTPTGEPTFTPTPTPTATPTPTLSPTPASPTPSSPVTLRGDANCDEEVDAVDALFVLRYVAGIPPYAACIDSANVKCDDAITSVDALFILRHVVDLPVNLPQGCDPLGTPAVAPGVR